MIKKVVLFLMLLLFTGCEDIIDTDSDKGACIYDTACYSDVEKSWCDNKTNDGGTWLPGTPCP